MAAEKYKTIAETLKTRILSGRCTARFPSAVALAREFHVSSRTIAKVFALLKHEQLIDPGSRGTYVAPKFRMTGAPRVILLGFREPHNLMLAQDRLFDCFSRRVEQAGFQLRLVDQSPASWAEVLKTDQVVGAALAYSSYSAGIGRLLENAAVPHVALNRYAGERPACWVDADWDHIIDQLCCQLAHHGFRRAALPMVCPEREGSRERYLQNAAAWQEATERYGMTHYSHDWRELQCAEPPDAIILFEKGQLPELREWYHRHGRPLTVFNFAPDVPLAQENCLRYVGFDYGKIADAGWQMLHELIRGGTPGQRHLLLKFSIRILFNNTPQGAASR